MRGLRTVLLKHCKAQVQAFHRALYCRYEVKKMSDLFEPLSFTDLGSEGEEMDGGK